MTFKIEIKRNPDKGTLNFSSGTVNISTTCYWNPDVVINAGTYTNCYATRMANKKDGSDGGKREAIWLGKNISFNKGTGAANGFFIHKYKGKDPVVWSDGCIVITESDLLKIWKAITPKDQPNVEITITDVVAGEEQSIVHPSLYGGSRGSSFFDCYY